MNKTLKIEKQEFPEEQRTIITVRPKSNSKLITLNQAEKIFEALTENKNYENKRIYLRGLNYRYQNLGKYEPLKGGFMMLDIDDYLNGKVKNADKFKKYFNLEFQIY